MRWIWLPLILLTAVHAQLPPSPPGAILIQPKPVSPKFAEQIQSWGAPMRSTPSFAPKVVTLPGFTITNLAVTGGQVTLQWKEGVPPFQVIGEPTLYGPWSDVGNPTTARSKVFPEDINHFFTVQGSIIMPLEATRTNNLTRLTWEAPDIDMSDSLQQFTLKRSTDGGVTFPNTVAVVQPGGTYSVDDTTAIPPGGSLTWELLEQTLNGVVVPYSKPVASNVAGGSITLVEQLGTGAGDIVYAVGIDPFGIKWALMSSVSGIEVMQLIKFNSDGSINFQHAYNVVSDGIHSSSGIRGTALVFDASGNCYITGYFDGILNTVDFGNGHVLTAKTTTATPDVFVAKFNNFGVCQAANNFGSNGQITFAGSNTNPTQGGLCLNVMPDGNLLVGGCVYGTADFGNGFTISSPSVGAGCGFVIKIRPSDLAETLWAIGIADSASGGDSTHGYVRGVASDSAGNFYVSAGFFTLFSSITLRGTSGLSTVLTPQNNGTDALLAKFNSSGVLLPKGNGSPYAINFGGSYNGLAVGGTCVAVGGDNNPVIGGIYCHTMDAGGGSITAAADPGAGMDAFIIKYLSDGAYSWGYYPPTKPTSPAGIFYPLSSLAIDANGSVIAAGFYSSSGMNVTRTPTSPGISDPNATLHTRFNNDMFNVKYSAAGAFQWAYDEGGTGLAELATSLATDKLVAAPTGVIAMGGKWGSNNPADSQITIRNAAPVYQNGTSIGTSNILTATPGASDGFVFSLVR